MSLTFAAQTTLAVGVQPVSVTAIDVNHDGKLDLVVGNSGADTTSVLLGNGDGTFAPEVHYRISNDGHFLQPPVVNSAAVADVNGDGNPDIIAVGTYSHFDSPRLEQSFVTVLTGNGDGTFTLPLQHINSGDGFEVLPVYYDVDRHAVSVTAADVDGDGKLDLIAANSIDDTVSVLRGNGDGTFQTQSTFAVGSSPRSVIAADVNGDGKLDLITANAGRDTDGGPPAPNANTISVLLGNGDGTFAPQSTYQVDRTPVSVAAADVDGDGKLDLITANRDNDTISVLLGNGDGTFGAPSALALAQGSGPNSITVLDVDGDGKLDLVTANGNDTVSLLLGDGHGSFTLQSPYPVGVLAIAVAAADLNGDGFVDVVTANLGEDDVSVLLGVPTLALTGITDDTGTAGDYITMDTSLTFTGTAAPNSMVEVFVDGVSIAFGNAGSDGHWSIDTASQYGVFAEGSYAIQILQTLNRTSQISAMQTLTVDTTVAAPCIMGVSPDTGIDDSDRITSSSTLVISGEAEGSSTIAIWDGATLLGTTVADPCGCWAYTTPTLSDGPHSFTAIATDVAGNVSAASAARTMTVDTTVAAPVISPVIADDTGISSTDRITNDTTFTLTGTAEAFSTVTIHVDGMITVIGTAVADASGNWSFTTTELAGQSNYFCYATATDLAGNVSGHLSPVVVTLDTEAPTTVPVIHSITNDTGASATDGITRDRTVVLSGTGEGSSLVEVLLDGHAIAVVQTDAAGAWTLDYGGTVLTDGTYHFTARTIDAAGNASPLSGDFTVVIDNAAPAAAAVTGISDDSGSSSSDTITSDTNIVINGNAEAHAIVEVFLDGTSRGTATADGSGAWSFDATAITLADGHHQLITRVSDVAGNSRLSAPVDVLVDTATPVVPTVTGWGDDTYYFFGQFEAVGNGHDGITQDSTITLNGTGEIGSIITVFDGAAALGTTVVGANGSWTYTTAPLIDGDHSLTATSTDAAGNQSAASAATDVHVDTTDPARPAVTGIRYDTGADATDGVTNDTHVILMGTADPGTRVWVTSFQIPAGYNVIGGGAGFEFADANGHWEVDLANLEVFTSTSPFHAPFTITDGSYTFVAEAIDLASNGSGFGSTFTVTIDTAPPAAAVITGITDDTGVNITDAVTSDTTPTLNGTAEPGAFIEVFEGTTSLGTVRTNEFGQWSFDLGTVSEGSHSYIANSTDLAGNAGPPSSAFALTVDATAPDTTITANPSDPSNSANASFSFTGSDPGGSGVAGFEVSIDGGEFIAGVSPSDFNDLVDGSHTVAVRAVDTAGNRDATPASFTWVVDTTAPTATASVASIDGNTGVTTGNLNAQHVARIVLTTDEAVAVDTTNGVPALHLNNGGTASYIAAASDSTHLVFSYTVAAGEDTPDLKVASLSLNGAIIADGAHNSLDTSSIVNASLALQIDTTAPTLASFERADPALTNAEHVHYTLTFSEAVTTPLTSDFALGAFTGVSGAQIVSVTPVGSDGTTFSVDVATGTGSSTINLDFTGNSIHDLAGNGFGGGAFPQSQFFFVSQSPTSFAVGDLNGDGKSDLVVTTHQPATFSLGTISVLLGNGDGSFQAPTVYAPNAFQSVVISDLNSDGVPDIIAGDFAAGLVSVLLGNGDGTFQSQVTYAVDSPPTSVAVADLNGDGKADLVSANNAAGSVSVLLGNGDGTFQGQAAYALAATPTSVAVADLDGDGKLDLVTTNPIENSLSILLGNGDGTLQPPTTIAVGSPLSSAAIADVNGDGNADLLAVDASDNYVAVLLGNGDGTFQSPATFAVGSTPQMVAVGDLNGDGELDLATTNYNDLVTSILFGNGDGTFQDQVREFPAGAPIGVAIDDVDGDGRLDLLQLTAGVLVTVALNTAPAQAGPIYTIDKFPPNPPFAVLTHDTGVSDGDRITNDPTIFYAPPAAGETQFYSLDGRSFGTTPPAFAIDGSDDGVHTITVENRDAAGNTSTFTLTFTLDTTGPVSSALVLANDTGNSSTDRLTRDPTIIYPTPAADDQVFYQLDGNGSLTPLTLATDGSADGRHNVLFVEFDQAGNGFAAQLMFTLDTKAPATPAAPVLVSDTGSSSTDKITRNPAITYPTAAAGDVLLYSLDGGSFTTTRPSFAVDGSYDGPHTVAIKERDAAGNISGVSSLAFTLDTLAPHITSDGGGDTTTVAIAETSTSVTTVAATDQHPVTYSIVGGADQSQFQISAATGVLSFINAPDFENPTDADHNGSYVVKVRVSDGDLAADQTITVNVTDVPETTHWMQSVSVGAHPAGWTPTAFADFNADSTSDVLWYNAGNNNVEVWKIAGGQWAASVDIGSHPPGYNPVGTGDFNHDGTSDVLWFNPATNETDIWMVSNGGWAGSTTIGTHPAGYQIAGIGDFNRDGTSDVFWYNPTTRDADIWLVNDGHWAGSIAIGQHPAGYQVAGIGDFNKDGTSDVLWVNPATNETDIWLVNDGHWAGSTTIGAHPAGYRVLGVGDFNQDRTSDVVWYDPTTNNIDIWLINNGQWAGSVDIGSHPAGSVAVGVGDFDHNGVADIMWHNPTTGQIDNWMLAYS